MSTWSGIGHIVVGMERQGFVVSLRRLVDDGWTASFHSHAMLAAGGIGTATDAVPGGSACRVAGAEPDADADAGERDRGGGLVIRCVEAATTV
jgi:hypothetical protein